MECQTSAWINHYKRKKSSTRDQNPRKQLNFVTMTYMMEFMLMIFFLSGGTHVYVQQLFTSYIANTHNFRRTVIKSICIIFSFQLNYQNFQNLFFKIVNFYNQIFKCPLSFISINLNCIKNMFYPSQSFPICIALIFFFKVNEKILHFFPFIGLTVFPYRTRKAMLSNYVQYF